VNESERLLGSLLAGQSSRIGQLELSRSDGGYALCHRDDVGRNDLRQLELDSAFEIAKFDDDGDYRPLKTAPTLRHGWKIFASNSVEMMRAIDAIYPARLAVLRAFESGRLSTTSLRETLNRQSGMYRVAARISDAQADALTGNFCRSDGGCLRTILWKRDDRGTVPSTKLPKEKFDAAYDQTGRGEKCIPLLCQEPCNLLVAACRGAVKKEGVVPPAH
jgi:sirohydrochlorin cobaltochelatase